MRSFKYRSLLAVLLPIAANSHATIEFDDISIDAGVRQFQAETWGAAVGDLNGDGYPDIHVTNHVTPSVLLRNNGDLSFTDVSLKADGSSAWITQYDRKVEEHGAAWADYDNDGDLDLATAHNFDSAIYENRNGVLFNLGKDLHSHRWRIQTVWFDENNDGWLDLGLSASVGGTQGSLFRNNNGSVPEQQTGSGLCSFNLLTLSDFNVDGDIDYTCSIYPQDFPAGGNYYTPGQGSQSGLPIHKPVQDAVSADFDGDLRPDLFMLRGALRPSDGFQTDSNNIEFHMTAAGSNTKTLVFTASGSIDVWIDWNRGDGANQSCQPLYLGADGHTSDGTNHTNVPGRFSEINLTLDSNDTRYHGLKHYTGCGSALGYFPAEGVWKLKLGGKNSHHMFGTVSANSSVTFDEIENTGINHGPLYPKYYLNKSSGYVDRSFLSGLLKERCNSVVAADLDNDMDLDLYLGCRGGSHNLPNVVYENLGSGTFSRVSNSGGDGDTGATWNNGQGAGNTDSVVALDMDLDGFIDIFATNGLNLRPHQGTGRYNLLRNKGNANHWVQLDLQGVQSNRDGIGAKIFATTPDGTVQLREQNGGFHRWSQNQMRVHFGLAAHNSVDLRIEWPSGTVDTIADVSADAIYKVQEGSNTAVVRNTYKPAPYPCNPPQYDKTTDKGLYIWQNCRNGIWHIRAVGGGVDADYTGSLILDAGSSSKGSIINLTPRSIEAEDTLTLVDAHTLSFDLSPGIHWEDGFSFKLDNLTQLACLQFTSAAGNSFYIGGEKRIINAANGLNLLTMNQCNGLPSNDNDGDGIPDDVDTDDDNDGVDDNQDAFPFNPNETEDSDVDGIGNNADLDDDNDGVADVDDAFPLDPSEDKDSDGDGIGDNSDPYPNDPTNGGPAAAACGEPSWSRSSDRATFIWKECTQTPQRWVIRVTGGGTNTPLTYDALINASGGISNTINFSIENSDVLDSSVTNQFSYQLKVFNDGVDGISFTVNSGACIKFNAPAQPVFIGANRQQLQNGSLSMAFDDLSECPTFLDSDGDGLSDAEEATLGTDANNADTDGGGVDDGTEVSNGTDPLDSTDDAVDTDQDGLSDADEALYGTDAANPDTDGERLSDGDEVHIHNTNPLKANTDKDGLSDWAEVTIVGTDPLDADSDDDGLSDGEERKTLNTDPLNADTDGGGTDDGVEISNGSNPLDPSDD